MAYEIKQKFIIWVPSLRPIKTGDIFTLPRYNAALNLKILHALAVPPPAPPRLTTYPIIAEGDVYFCNIEICCVRRLVMGATNSPLTKQLCCPISCLQTVAPLLGL